MRAIITNVDLRHWGKRETNLCSFCEMHKETLIHLFCECKDVQRLWECIPGVIPGVKHVELLLHNEAKIFNKIVTSPGHVYNFIAIVLKQYVYRQRCLKGKLSVTEFTCYVRSIKNSEKYYASKSNMLEKASPEVGSGRRTLLLLSKIVTLYVNILRIFKCLNVLFCFNLSRPNVKAIVKYPTTAK